MDRRRRWRPIAWIRLGARNATVRIAVALALGLLAGLYAPAGIARLGWIMAAATGLARWIAYPTLFACVAHAVADVRAAPSLRRLGWRALVCFEGLTAASVVTGMAAAALLGSGRGLLQAAPGAHPGVHPGALSHAHPGAAPGMLSAHSFGPLLACLAGALLLGMWLRKRDAARTRRALARARRGLFWSLRAFAWLAPLPAFASAALLTQAYGWCAWTGLLDILGGLYVGSLAYAVLVLGGVCLACGVGPLRLAARFKDELLLAIGTAASLAAMDGVMRRLEGYGCSRAAVRFLVPLNYSIGLNGTSVYLGFCLVALRNAGGAPPDAAEMLQLALLAILAGKCAFGAAGSAYMALGLAAGALPGMPLEGLAVLIGIERLLKCRLAANVLGIAVGCLAACTWCGERRREPVRSLAAREAPACADDLADVVDVAMPLAHGLPLKA